MNMIALSIFFVDVIHISFTIYVCTKIHYKLRTYIENIQASFARLPEMTIIPVHTIHFQIYFAKVKINFALMKIIFALMKINFALMKINFALMKINFALMKINFSLMKINFALMKMNFALI